MLKYFWVKKRPPKTHTHNNNKTVAYIQEQCFCKLGKIQSELKLIFCVCYLFLKLNTGIMLTQLVSYFPSHGISQRKGGTWSEAKWDKHIIIYISYPHWILLMPVFQWHYKHKLSTCKQRTCAPISLELLHSANHNKNHKNMRVFFKQNTKNVHLSNY